MVTGTSTEGATEISESQKTPETSSEVPPNTPEVSDEPMRITNTKEGNKKQKEAARKLSEYSKEATKRRKGQDTDEKPANVSETSEESLSEVVPDTQSTIPPQGGSAMLSTGNIIAALGVGVAALCLYLSYKPDSSQNVQQTPSKPPPQPPQTQRFRRL